MPACIFIHAGVFTLVESLWNPCGIWAKYRFWLTFDSMYGISKFKKWEHGASLYFQDLQSKQKMKISEALGALKSGVTFFGQDLKKVSDKSSIFFYFFCWKIEKPIALAKSEKIWKKNFVKKNFFNVTKNFNDKKWKRNPDQKFEIFGDIWQVLKFQNFFFQIFSDLARAMDFSIF